MALGSAVGVSAQQPPHFDGPQKAAPDNPTTVFADSFSARWIEDSEFVYGPALIDFDLRSYLAASAPHLLPHAEFISHWAGFYSINPKVLLALLDLRSGLMSSSAVGVMANQSRGLVAGNGVEQQAQNLLVSLFVDFYAYRRAAADTRGQAINAATFALLNLYRGGRPAERLTRDTADDTRRAFLQTYARLFPAKPHAGDVVVAQADAPPASFLQFPWKHNSAWFFNGVHTQTGSDPGALSAMDFTRTWDLRWGDDTSTDYVVAAHAGTVTVFSSCNVRVTAANGWATSYYHLSNVTVANGAHVEANDTIGTYADTTRQALCQGGMSTGPHVHLSLLQNGMYAPLDGVQFSGNVVHAGRMSYDADPEFMWLQSEESGSRYYAYETPLLSLPTAPNRPAAPANLVAAVRDRTISLTWSAVGGGQAPTDHVLEAAESSTFSRIVYGPVAIGAGTSAAVAVPAGTSGTFYLRVSARNGNVTGAPSNIAVVTLAPQTSGGTPGQPGVPTVQVNGDRTITASWSAPAFGPSPTNYRIYVSSSSGPLPGSPFALPAVTAAVSPMSLPPGHYSMTVAAISAGGEGPPSAPTSFAVMGSCNAAPNPPMDLGIATLDAASVRLHWTAAAGPNMPTAYRLQASRDAAFGALVVDLDLGNVSAFDASGASGTYFVRVVALNECGASPASNIAIVNLP